MLNKNLFFKLFLTFTLMALITTSCDKDEEVKKSTTTNSSTEIRNAAPKEKAQTYFLDIGAEQLCTKIGSNCNSAGQILSGPNPIMEALDEAITQGPIGVKNFFSGDLYPDLFPNLEADNHEMLSSLQSGNFEMEKIIDPNNSNHIIYRAYNELNEDFGLQLYIEEE